MNSIRTAPAQPFRCNTPSFRRSTSDRILFIIGKYSTVSVIRRQAYPRDRRQAGLSKRSGSDPAEERDGRGAIIGAIVTRRRGFLNLLARPQITQCGSCVIHRTVQGTLDCPDALCVQALLRLDRTEVHERATDFLFLLGRHPATSITTVLQ